MFVASKRLNGPVGGRHGHTMGTAVLASATVRRQAGAQQVLLTLFIENYPLQPLPAEIASACLN
jgi:hypothetical protein